jgi:hypothetical protein
MIGSIPPASRGTLVLANALLGRSETAAIVLRSIVGYDEGLKVETEFLLRSPGVERRPLRDALNPQNADPAISFGDGVAGDFHPVAWNVVGALSISTLSADDEHSRLTVRTWIKPTPPEELIVGVRWLSQDVAPTLLRVDCRRTGTWSVPLWPDAATGTEST